jgi:hypothetical protein
MLIGDFDSLMEARPFHPFRIYTSDGRSVLVKSPEFAWHPPANRIIWVASGRGDDRVHMIDLQLVTKFVLTSSNGKSNGSKRRKK